MPMKKFFTLIYLFKRYCSFEVPFDESTFFFTDAGLSEVESPMRNPSGETIQRIMDFSRVYAVIETDRAGQIELILN